MSRVRFERDGDVGVVTLADPPLNLFGRELLADLNAGLDEVADAGVRAPWSAPRAARPAAPT